MNRLSFIQASTHLFIWILSGSLIDSCLLANSRVHLAPLFDDSLTKQEFILSESLCQTTTLQSHPNGEPAIVWKSNPWLKEPDIQEIGWILRFDQEGKIYQKIAAKLYQGNFIFHGDEIQWSYTPNGLQEPLLHAQWVEGKRCGELTIFRAGGKLRYKASYLHGVLEGSYILYNENGWAFEQGSYVNGKRHGTSWRFDDQGFIQEEMTYLNGLAHGLCITLDEVSQCQNKARYWMGFLHDFHEPAFQQVRTDQSLAFSAYYFFNHPAKQWVFYDDKAIPFLTLQWKNHLSAQAIFSSHPKKPIEWKQGRLVAPAQGWYSNGKPYFDFFLVTPTTFKLKLYNSLGYLERDSLYENFQGEFVRQGEEVTYAADGSTIKKQTFNKGIPKTHLSQITRIPPTSSDTPQDEPIITYYPDGKLREKHTFLNKQRLHSELWHSNGQLAFEGSYKNGRREGAHTAYYPSGKIQFCFHFHEGKHEGSYEVFDEVGNLRLKALYHQDQLEGPFLQTLEDGRKLECHFEKGTLEGSFKVYYPLHEKTEQTLAFEVTYHQGLRDGVARDFSPNGSKLREICYKKGKLEGLAYQYYPSTRVMLEILYQQGKREGSFKHFDESGQLLRSSPYKNDELEGTERVFGNNKQLLEENNYHEGLLHGIQKQYNTHGKLIYQASWYEGELNGKLFKYTDEGKPLLEILYEQGKPLQKQRFTD